MTRPEPSASNHLVRFGNGLAEWYADRMRGLLTLPVLDRCELLLTAADLRLSSRRIVRCVTELIDAEENAPESDDESFRSFARQLVLMRFGVGEQLRRRFLERWLIQERYRGQPITTVAFVMTLALQQGQLLTEQHRAHARDWFLKHDDFESDRYAAWSCYCLMLAGFESLARTRALKVLERRESNGSWGRDVRRTIWCSYALLLGALATPDELRLGLTYVASRLTPGFSNDIGTQAQSLKTFYIAGMVSEQVVSKLRASLANEQSVFLSHSHEDKAFVRRLAEDLRREGIRVWLDEAELLPGDSLLDRIESAIEEMQYLAVVLSPSSVASNWVKKELRMAQTQELAEHQIRVLPIVASPCVVPLSLRDTVWADFSVDYQVGLKSLLRRLA